MTSEKKEVLRCEEGRALVMPACFSEWPGEGPVSLELVSGLPPLCHGEAGRASNGLA